MIPILTVITLVLQVIVTGKVITIVMVTVTVTVMVSDSNGDSYSLMLRCGSMRNLGLSYSYGVVRCRFS